jgi:hypothetical protein
VVWPPFFWEGDRVLTFEPLSPQAATELPRRSAPARRASTEYWGRALLAIDEGFPSQEGTERPSI